MTKGSASILAAGLFASSVVMYLGLIRLAASVEVAGRASRPHHQIDLKIEGGSEMEPLVIKHVGR